MDLTVHPKETNMSFLDPVSGSWASLSGTASIIADPKTVEEYYTPALKAWLGDMGDGVHDGGPKDPRIGVIKLEAKLATYVLPRKGILGRAYDTIKGAASGDVPAINSIRELSQGELAECKCSLFFPFCFLVECWNRQADLDCSQGAGHTNRLLLKSIGLIKLSCLVYTFVLL